MIDRTTKLLLAAIAFGLWANAFIPILRPSPANATAESSLESIDRNIASLANGICSNRKMCGF